MPSLAEMLIAKASANPGADAPLNTVGALQVGAQIAEHAQNLDLQRQQIEMQKAQIHDAKLEKFAQAVEKGQQYAGKAQSTYYNNFLPGLRDSLGLHNDITDDSLKMITAPETKTLFGYMSSSVARGEMTRGQVFKLYSDPVALHDYAQQAGIPITDSQTGFTQLSDADRKELFEAEQHSEANKAQVGKQQTQIAHEDFKDFNTYKGDLAKQMRSDFKPIQAKQESVRNALDAGQRIHDALASGQKPSAQDAKVLAFNLLRGEVGRVNGAEIEAYTGQPGIMGWSEDKLVHYITGGVNAETVSNLIKVAKSTAKNIDTEMNTTADSFRKQVQNSAYAPRSKEILDPLGALVQPTWMPKAKQQLKDKAQATPPGTPTTVQFNGQQVPVEAAQDYIAKNPNHPDAQALKAQLAQLGVK